jgi:hypothetical protein
MARHGVRQLLDASVLERTPRAGRGQDYRCSLWALGQSPAATSPAPGPDAAQAPQQASHKNADVPLAPSVSREASESMPELTAVRSSQGEPPVGSEVAVEIGGLVLHLPVGTQIRMTIDADGTSSYEVGPLLRFKQQLPR